MVNDPSTWQAARQLQADLLSYIQRNFVGGNSNTPFPVADDQLNLKPASRDRLDPTTYLRGALSPEAMRALEECERRLGLTPAGGSETKARVDAVERGLRKIVGDALVNGAVTPDYSGTYIRDPETGRITGQLAVLLHMTDTTRILNLAKLLEGADGTNPIDRGNGAPLAPSTTLSSDRIQKRIERLEELKIKLAERLEGGVITAEEYDRRLSRLDALIDRYQKQLADRDRITKRPDPSPEDLPDYLGRRRRELRELKDERPAKPEIPSL